MRWPTASGRKSVACWNTGAARHRSLSPGLRPSAGQLAAGQDQPAASQALCQATGTLAKTGRIEARILACMAARFNPDIKAKYTHLISIGKPAKVAITAVMRKLIVTANALLKADRLWAVSMA